MAAPPAGTLTMLFTDIEGSTSLAHELGGGWGDVLRAHHDVLAGAIAAHGGYVDGVEGDAFFALFADARSAVGAAVAAQRGLRDHAWPTASAALRVRMGLHTGHVERRDTGYVGLEIHRAARVGSAAHGGQILLTEVTRSLAADVVPTEPLGQHRLKDFPTPEMLHCAVIDGAGAASFPPPRTLQIRPTNLPADHRPLVGRDGDLAAIIHAFTVDGDRMVTLAGGGGTGKTRLALAAGAELLDSHPGGVWWIPLAAETDAAAALPRLAVALHADGDGTRSAIETLAVRIGSVPTLAVLDNLEQLPGLADDLAPLFAAAPGLRVLATSQVPLRLSTERVLALGPLDPDASCELFVALAARRRPDVVLDAVVVAALCERLEHLPLSIELAAGRLAVLTPEQILERLSAPLKLLKGGARDAPERQRSLRATIDWTLGLLEPEPRSLFTRLGVFAGAVELQDIEAVCEDDEVDVLEAVASLLDCGLLRRREDGDGGVRLRLPEALRQVARDELDASADGAAWRRAHAEHLVESLEPVRLAYAVTDTAYRRARLLIDEARQGFDWAWHEDLALAARLGALVIGAGIVLVWVAEVEALAERLLAMDGIPDRERASALIARGFIARLRNQPARGEALAVLALKDPTPPLRRWAEKALMWEDLRAGRDARGTAHAMIDDARARGDELELTVALGSAADAHRQVGELEIAIALLDEAAAVARSCDSRMQWHLDTMHADIALARGDAVGAAAAYLRSMTVARERGDLVQVQLDLYGLAATLASAERDDAALEVKGLADALGAEIDFVLPDHLPGREYLDQALERLGPQTAAGALARGRAIPAGMRVERARELAAAIAAVPR